MRLTSLRQKRACVQDLLRQGSGETECGKGMAAGLLVVNCCRHLFEYSYSSKTTISSWLAMFFMQAQFYHISPGCLCNHKYVALGSNPRR